MSSSEEKYSSDDESIYDPNQDEDAVDDDDEEDEEEESERNLSVKRPRNVQANIQSKKATVRRERNVPVADEDEKLHFEDAFIDAFDDCVLKCREQYGHLCCAFNAKDTSLYLGYVKGEKKGFLDISTYLINVLKEICLILTNLIFISNPEAVSNTDQTEWVAMEITKVNLLYFNLL